MKLYEEVVDTWQRMLSPFDVQALPISRPGWPDTGSRNMILRSEMAYELGAEGSYALGATVAVNGLNQFREDQILLCGPDLPDISGNCSYARLVIASIRDNLPNQGDALYRAIKKIDFVRYHLNPEGFMPRISSIRGTESARIQRKALDSGMNFSLVGSRMLESYHENPEIEAVSLIFITNPDFPFSLLAESIKKCREITMAIDHAMQTSMTDCNVCSLKKICDEVDGIRELHFHTDAESTAHAEATGL